MRRGERRERQTFAGELRSKLGLMFRDDLYNCLPLDAIVPLHCYHQASHPVPDFFFFFSAPPNVAEPKSEPASFRLPVVTGADGVGAPPARYLPTPPAFAACCSIDVGFPFARSVPNHLDIHPTVSERGISNDARATHVVRSFSRSSCFCFFSPTLARSSASRLSRFSSLFLYVS